MKVSISFALSKFLSALSSNQTWVKKELGDEPFSCLIMIQCLVVNGMFHDGWIWGKNITYKCVIMEKLILMFYPKLCDSS